MFHLEVQLAEGRFKGRNVDADFLFLDKGNVFVFGEVDVQELLDELSTAIYIHLVRRGIFAEKHTGDADKVGVGQRGANLVAQAELAKHTFLHIDIFRAGFLRTELQELGTLAHQHGLGYLHSEVRENHVLHILHAPTRLLVDALEEFCPGNRADLLLQVGRLLTRIVSIRGNLHFAFAHGRGHDKELRARRDGRDIHLAGVQRTVDSRYRNAGRLLGCGYVEDERRTVAVAVGIVAGYAIYQNRGTFREELFIVLVEAEFYFRVLVRTVINCGLGEAFGDGFANLVMLRLLGIDLDLLGKAEEVRMHRILVGFEFTHVVFHLVFRQSRIRSCRTRQPLSLLVDALARIVRGGILQRLTVVRVRIAAIIPDNHFRQSHAAARHDSEDEEQHLRP